MYATAIDFFFVFVLFLFLYTSRHEQALLRS